MKNNNSKLSLTLDGSYRKEGGKVVFRYKITGGSQTDKDRYKTLMGDNYRCDEEGDKAPFYFTTAYAGEKANLLITNNDKVIIDDSETDKIVSLCSKFQGTALGDAMAKVGAEKIMGVRANPAPLPDPVPAE